MKPIKTLSPSVLIVALACIACIAASNGQTAKPSSHLRDSIAAKQQAADRSEGYFKNGDLTKGEEVLSAGNIAAANTPRGHVEMGFGLIQFAVKFQAQGQGTLTNALAKRALVHLQQAVLNFGANDDAGEIANAYELEGVLYEDYLGDRQGALTAFAMAVKLSPQTGQAASRLARLRQSETDLKTKS